MEWISETKKGRKPIKCVLSRKLLLQLGSFPQVIHKETELFQLTGKGTGAFNLPTPHPSLVKGLNQDF